MRLIKFSFLPLAAALITGCGVHPQTNYAPRAHVSAPLTTPKNVSLRSEQSYYTLPRKPNLQSKQPSLVPPGSNLARFNTTKSKKVQAKAQHFTKAKWSNTAGGEPILELRENTTTAWSEVGKALRDTDYQILDQDPSMSSYYILDTGVTSNEVTEKTPIYRVYIKKNVGDTSEIVLMDENNNMVLAKTAKRVLRDIEQHMA